MYGMDIRERDHWGYWNPFSGLYPAPANYFNKRKYNSIDGGNRHAYPDGSDMGMLQSITYPTTLFLRHWKGIKTQLPIKPY